MDNLRVVSDGTTQGTKVYVGDEELKYVSSIVLSIDAGSGIVTADVSVFNVGVDMAVKEDHVVIDTLDISGDADD